MAVMRTGKLSETRVMFWTPVAIRALLVAGAAGEEVSQAEFLRRAIRERTARVMRRARGER